MKNSPLFFILPVLLVVAGAISGVAPPCAAQKPVVSSHKQAALLRGWFRTIKTVAGLPPAVKRAFPDPEMQRKFHMADPGKPFQVTDVVTDKTLPRRRLIVAGIGDNSPAGRRCFILYERGGRGRSRQLLILDLPAGGKAARPIWHGFGGPQTERAASVEAVRNALARGEFSEASLSTYGA